MFVLQTIQLLGVPAPLLTDKLMMGQQRAPTKGKRILGPETGHQVLLRSEQRLTSLLQRGNTSGNFPFLNTQQPAHAALSFDKIEVHRRTTQTFQTYPDKMDSGANLSLYF